MQITVIPVERLYHGNGNGEDGMDSESIQDVESLGLIG